MMKRDNFGIQLLLDTRSIEGVIPQLSRRATSLLKYYNQEPLVFVRTPDPTSNTMLLQIPAIEIIRENNKISYLQIPRKNFTSKHAVNQFIDIHIQKMGELLFNKTSLTNEECKTIELAFIQQSLNEFEGRNLLVTENEILLTNRQWFQSKFSSPLNIVCMEEAAEIVDLLFKYNSNFFMSPHFTTSKHNWYWLSFRNKVPNFHVDMTRFQNQQTVGDLFKSSILDAFSQRFCFLLMSIDEMGYKFYSPVNNDTIEDTTYHFNYFILLITGIFDSLAIHTKNRYHLFEDSEKIKPSEISLRSKIGKEFLQAVEHENPDLRKHIHNNVHLINSPYLLRELIAHRESLHPHHFNINGSNANFLFVTEKFVECLTRLGDDSNKKGGRSKFGVYSNRFLSPYTFAKTITVLLTDFCNQYLKLLGYSNYLLEEQKTKDNDFFNTMKLFQEDNLGF